MNYLKNLLCKHRGNYSQDIESCVVWGDITPEEEEEAIRTGKRVIVINWGDPQDTQEVKQWEN